MERNKDEQENHERWLVSYADFITLLFAFFTVLYATSQADNEKMAKFEQSFKQAFGIYNSNAEGVLSQPFPFSQTEGSVIESPIKVFNDKYASKAEVRDAIWQVIYNSLTEEQIKQSGLVLADDKEGVRVGLASNSLFVPGSAKILPDALKALDVVGDILKKSGKQIQIEGHTDNAESVGGIFPSHWELAAGRAATIVRYMVKRHKLEPALLSAVSYADQRPLVSNSSEENKSKNRRIELLISLNSH